MQRWLKLAVMAAVITLSALWAASVKREAAIALLKAQGPSEIDAHVVYGFDHVRCSGEAMVVAFWQRGPNIPERQGYVCGGILAAPVIELVPFDEVMISGLLDV